MIGDAPVARAAVGPPEEPDDFAGAIDDDRSRIAKVCEVQKARERVDEDLAPFVQHVDDGAARQTCRRTALAYFGEANSLSDTGQCPDVNDIVNGTAVSHLRHDVAVEFHGGAVDLCRLSRPQHGADLVERAAAATGDMARLADLDTDAREAGRRAERCTRA